MRINIYAEELTDETAIVKKTVSVNGEPKYFFGVRLYLKSPKELHATPDDDDRSAITFWVPFYNGRNQHEELIRSLDHLLGSSLEARRQDTDSLPIG